MDRRYARWLELTAHVLSQPSIALPQNLVAAEIINTFDCAAVGLVSPDGTSRPRLSYWPDRYLPLIEQYTPGTYALNPLYNYYRITSDPSARCISEVPSSITDRRGWAAWREFSEPWQVDYQLAMPLSATAPAYRAYVLGRPSGPFTRQERELAQTVQPVLAAVDRQAAVLRHLPPQRSTDPTDPPLTGRELAVLALLAQGLTAASIGRRLGITPRTVTKHLERIYAKLQVNNRVAAVVAAQQIGVLPISDAPHYRPANQ